MKRPYGLAAVVLAFLLVLPSCKTIEQLANLRSVDFAIDRVASARLGGIELSRLRSYEDLTAGDVFRVGQMVANEEAPLSFTLHLNAENPSKNDVNARLVEMDWTLLLDDTETVSGTFDQNILLSPGTTQDVPIAMEVDLVDFFDRGARDLIELALAVSGQGGEPKRIHLRAQPTIDTPIGPIRYPQPIMIDVGEVGQGGTSEGR